MRFVAFFITVLMLTTMMTVVMATGPKETEIDFDPDLEEKTVSLCFWCNALNYNYCCSLTGPCCMQGTPMCSKLEL